MTLVADVAFDKEAARVVIEPILQKAKKGTMYSLTSEERERVGNILISADDQFGKAKVGEWLKEIGMSTIKKNQFIQCALDAKLPMSAEERRLEEIFKSLSTSPMDKARAVRLKVAYARWHGVGWGDVERFIAKEWKVPFQTIRQYERISGPHSDPAFQALVDKGRIPLEIAEQFGFGKKTQALIVRLLESDRDLLLEERTIARNEVTEQRREEIFAAAKRKGF